MNHIKARGLFLGAFFMCGFVCFIGIKDCTDPQCSRSAFCAFQTPQAVVAVRVFVRLNTVAAQGSAAPALCALMFFELHGECREAVKEAEDDTQRTQHPAPRTNTDEYRNQKQHDDRQFYRIRPRDRIALNRGGRHIRHGFFQSARRTDPADKQRMFLTEKSRESTIRPRTAYM